ncbi:conserved hypothetical protein [Paenibacillus curdlanolyticus YK9]|uniref:Uncharacterized protein n=1 Tax=Paenibacillus curdlanolyticus YK9 TaxID=717606 RepID=E0IAG0_9BACL|nr:conserved hypothetical protein [Paenibacillus curdlanolyticus YK9]
MPAWMEWLMHHWVSSLLVLGVVLAIVYVFSNRSSLFYKE